MKNLMICLVCLSQVGILFALPSGGKKEPPKDKDKPSEKCYESDDSVLCLWTGKQWKQCEIESSSTSSVECTFDPSKAGKYRDRSPPYSDDECCLGCPRNSEGEMMCECGEDDLCNIRIREYYERKKKEYLKSKKKKRGDDVRKRGGSKKDRRGGGGSGGAVKVKREAGIWDFWKGSSSTPTSPTNITATTEISTAPRVGRAVPVVALTPLVVSGGIHVTKETLRYLAPYLVANTLSSQIGQKIRGYLPTFLGGEAATTTPPPPVEINLDASMLQQISSWWGKLTPGAQAEYLPPKKGKKPGKNHGGKKPKKPGKGGKGGFWG